jgi:hypothetical protein
MLHAEFQVEAIVLERGEQTEGIWFEGFFRDAGGSRYSVGENAYGVSHGYGYITRLAIGPGQLTRDG